MNRKPPRVEVTWLDACGAGQDTVRPLLGRRTAWFVTNHDGTVDLYLDPDALLAATETAHWHFGRPFNASLAALVEELDESGLLLNPEPVLRYLEGQWRSVLHVDPRFVWPALVR